MLSLSNSLFIFECVYFVTEYELEGACRKTLSQKISLKTTSALEAVKPRWCKNVSQKPFHRFLS